MKYQYLKIFFACLFLFVFSAGFVFAQINEWGNKVNETADDSGIYKTYSEEGDDSASVALVKYIATLLTWTPLLAVSFIIQLVLAGYEWTIAAGNQEKVKHAKSRITFAVIGLLILIGLYVIAVFFVKNFAATVNYGIE